MIIDPLVGLMILWLYIFQFKSMQNLVFKKPST